MFCGSCGARNPDDASFCSSCGKPLVPPDKVGVTPAPAPTPAPIPTPPPPPPVDKTQIFREAARDFAAQKDTSAVGTVRGHVRNALRDKNQTAEQVKQELASKGFDPLHADLLIKQERDKMEAQDVAFKKRQRKEAGGGAVFGGFAAILLCSSIVHNLNQQGFQWNMQDFSQWLPAILFVGGIIAIIRGIYLLASSG